MALEYNPPEWIAGDTKSIEFIIGDDRGIPIDITDYTGKMEIRGSTNGIVLATSIATIDTSINSMKFEFLPEETANLRAGSSIATYVYDAESVSGTGVVTTEIYGLISVRTDITR